MVDDRGQLYTIEGFAAAIIMIFSVYLVLNSTTIYTPGDSHISDLQLAQLGHDVLRTMSIPPDTAGQSPLQQYVEQNQPASFNEKFINGINNRTGFLTDTLQYSASVSCRNDVSGEVIQTPFASSRNLTGREHAVRVTEWVLVEQRCPLSGTGPVLANPRAMLVEVFLWRE